MHGDGLSAHFCGLMVVSRIGLPLSPLPPRARRFEARAGDDFGTARILGVLYFRRCAIVAAASFDCRLSSPRSDFDYRRAKKKIVIAG